MVFSQSAYDVVPTYTPKYTIEYDFGIIKDNYNSTVSHIKFDKNSKTLHVFLSSEWLRKSSIEQQILANDIGVELNSALKTKHLLENSDELNVNYYLDNNQMCTYSSKKGVKILQANEVINLENTSE
ncbi:hypothetical protein [Methanococcus voltae]|uniref:Uncharacterized protein n=2 Tax=Methanococcus voltae TaxID=2188 RepID=A0A8J7S5T9_METVO|nr:hypothetical protein [Methanococcus voltae]MBP2173011.1 hypothetical protein [Methanococcus voltae]MBP2201933.1 hypothetical protein [Methanococcus voltae]MCS3922097.1 hypothetical protein [Methanococcus voltae PS]